MPNSVPYIQIPQEKGANLVAIILAVGMCTALNVIVFAVLWDALFSNDSGLSENATQILTGWGGGIIGVIGAVVGYRSGEAAATRRQGNAATFPDSGGVG